MLKVTLSVRFSISVYEMRVVWNHVLELEEEAMVSKEKKIIGLV